MHLNELICNANDKKEIIIASPYSFISTGFAFLIFALLATFHAMFLIKVGYYSIRPSNLILSGIILYLGYRIGRSLIYKASARISGDRLILKKFLRPARSYPFSSIGYIRAKRGLRGKHTSVEMRNGNKGIDKYIIYTYKDHIIPETIDAEMVLFQLRQIVKINRVRDKLAAK